MEALHRGEQSKEEKCIQIQQLPGQRHVHSVEVLEVLTGTYFQRKKLKCFLKIISSYLIYIFTFALIDICPLSSELLPKKVLFIYTLHAYLH